MLLKKVNHIFSKQRFGRCCAVIVAAGASVRMKGGNKQFAELLDMPVLAHTLKVFQDCGAVSEMVVVVKKEELDHAADICLKYGIDKAVHVIAGGKTRLESVINGVRMVPRSTRLIAIHDGARPCVSKRIIENTIAQASKKHAAVPAVPVTSTIKRAENNTVTETVDRNGLYEIQTPQVFQAELIKTALAKARNSGADITDDCMAVEALGVLVHITEGSHSNIKITTKADIKIAEAILKGRETVPKAEEKADGK